MFYFHKKKIGFNANKRHEVIKTIRQYQEDVITYGFFTNDDYKTAKLIADSISAYNKRSPDSYVFNPNFDAIFFFV